jgi:hypothetical protein
VTGVPVTPVVGDTTPLDDDDGDDDTGDAAAVVLVVVAVVVAALVEDATPLTGVVATAVVGVG